MNAIDSSKVKEYLNTGTFIYLAVTSQRILFTFVSKLDLILALRRVMMFAYYLTLQRIISIFAFIIKCMDFPVLSCNIRVVLKSLWIKQRLHL